MGPEENGRGLVPNLLMCREVITISSGDAGLISPFSGKAKVIVGRATLSLLLPCSPPRSSRVVSVALELGIGISELILLSPLCPATLGATTRRPRIP